MTEETNMDTDFIDEFDEESTSPEPELPRWILVPIGVFLGLFLLLCLAGSLMMVLLENEKAPILAPLFGTFMVVLCLFLLAVCLRMITGRKTKGGLFSPTQLRYFSWMFLLLPIGGIFSGYFLEKPVIATVQTIAYVCIFFGLRTLAAQRERDLAVMLGELPNTSSIPPTSAG